MSSADDEIARTIGEACGAVSLCWDPRPTGVFDSETASRFVDEAVGEMIPLLLERAERRGAENALRYAAKAWNGADAPSVAQFLIDRADRIARGER